VKASKRSRSRKLMLSEICKRGLVVDRIHVDALYCPFRLQLHSPLVRLMELTSREFAKEASRIEIRHGSGSRR